MGYTIANQIGVLNNTSSDNQDVWSCRLALLLDFATREGHCSVPARHVEAGIRLGNWVVAQRQAYRNGLLAEGRIAALTAIPNWAWNARDAQWEQNFALLEEYMNINSSLPITHTIFRGSQLGNWIRDQRQAHSQGKLTAQREQRLANLSGWTWKGKRGRPSKKSGAAGRHHSPGGVTHQLPDEVGRSRKFCATKSSMPFDS